MNPQDYNQNPYGAPQNPQGAPQLTPEQIAQMQGFYGAQNPQGQFVQPQQGYPQPQMPVQPAQNYPQNFQPAPNQVQSQPNFAPNQQYSGVPQSENPYTVEYLNSIAPKQAPSFWTKQKIFLAGFVVIGLILSVAFMMFGDKGTSNAEAANKIYHNLLQLESITNDYQKRLKNSDLSAANAGMITSLATNRKSLTDYMTAKKVPFLTGAKLAKSESYSKNSQEYALIRAKLDDAVFKTTLDETYIREMTYQLAVVKGLIAKLKTRLNSKSANETLDQIIANFEISTKALNDSRTK